MKFQTKSKSSILGVLIVVILLGCKTEKIATSQFSLNNEIDSVSYSLGLSVALGVKSQGLDSINQEAISKAFQDVFSDDSLRIEEDQANTILTSFFQSQAAKIGELNMKKGKEFLASNASKDGVITTQSGLQYTILKEGSGQIPAASDNVTTHYTGTTLSGEVFDSSVERGEPLEFLVSGVIPGWTEALQLMPVGSKWKLFVPSDLAYGPRGAGPDIGPNSVLIFELELLGIN